MRTAPRELTLGLRLTAAGIAATCIAGAAHATTVYDSPLIDPPGFYNGTDNPNVGFTSNVQNGVELGLGVNLRFVAPVHPSSGTSIYNVPLGISSGAAGTWDFLYSVNLQAAPGNAGLHLSDISTNMHVLNVGNGQFMDFNPLGFPFFDNAGWDGTAENVVGPGNLASDFGFQNSQNLGFLFFAPLFNPNFGYDPLTDDTYIFTLSLTGPNALDLSVNETVIAGAGAAATPLPAALPLFASGLGVFGFFARRRRNKKKAAQVSA